ncbi:hypothetical protein B0H13DRAFT_368390 [Mycena leptocephala]|nr:hypothetical protein B0H13DRAFT_368390 [Mycena leptocephala]
MWRCMMGREAISSATSLAFLLCCVGDRLGGHLNMATQLPDPSVEPFTILVDFSEEKIEAPSSSGTPEIRRLRAEKHTCAYCSAAWGCEQWIGLKCSAVCTSYSTFTMTMGRAGGNPRSLKGTHVDIGNTSSNLRKHSCATGNASTESVIASSLAANSLVDSSGGHESYARGMT